MQSCVLTRSTPQCRPLQEPAPLKRASFQPRAGAARRFRCVPRGNSARQTPGQWIPFGVERTEPWPWMATNAT